MCVSMYINDWMNHPRKHVNGIQQCLEKLRHLPWSQGRLNLILFRADLAFPDWIFQGPRCHSWTMQVRFHLNLYTNECTYKTIISFAILWKNTYMNICLALVQNLSIYLDTYLSIYLSAISHPSRRRLRINIMAEFATYNVSSRNGTFSSPNYPLASNKPIQPSMLFCEGPCQLA